jgi:hypothetical protein
MFARFHVEAVNLIHILLREALEEESKASIDTDNYTS